MCASSMLNVLPAAMSASASAIWGVVNGSFNHSTVSVSCIGQLLQLLDGDQYRDSLGVTVDGDRFVSARYGLDDHVASTGPRTSQLARQRRGRIGQAICT